MEVIQIIAIVLAAVGALNWVSWPLPGSTWWPSPAG